MEQFAEVSGLSRPTVSKFFNDPQSVRPATRRRIEDALERYDYRPNIYAINQNRRLTKTIGIVVPYLADPFFVEIARTIENRCIEAGFSPSLFSSHGKPELEIEILDALRSMKPAGVLIAPLGKASDKSLLERFCRDVPTVLFDSYLENIGEAFIGSNNRQFTSEMVEYLCRTGEPPVYFEMKTPPNPNTNRRRNGYLQAMQERGHDPQIISVEGAGWELGEIGYQGAMKVLGERGMSRNTVFCTNDRLAIGFIAACYKMGLKVGLGSDCDIRVAGMDDHPFARFTCPAMTTVAHNYDAISECTAKTLLELIEGGSLGKSPEERFFDGKLIMRASA